MLMLGYVKVRFASQGWSPVGARKSKKNLLIYEKIRRGGGVSESLARKTQDYPKNIIKCTDYIKDFFRRFAKQQ